VLRASDSADQSTEVVYMLDSTRRHGNGHDALFSGGQRVVPAYRLNSAYAIVIVRFD
jgi:hypothetical protein